MFSLRLPPELEAQLDRYAISNGVAKNAVVAQALAQFFKTVDTRTVPLEEPVQEAGIEESAYDRHVRKTQEQQKLYLEAHKIAESIRLNEI